RDGSGPTNSLAELCVASSAMLSSAEADVRHSSEHAYGAQITRFGRVAGSQVSLADTRARLPQVGVAVPVGGGQYVTLRAERDVIHALAAGVGECPGQFAGDHVP